LEGLAEHAAADARDEGGLDAPRDVARVDPGDRVVRGGPLRPDLVEAVRFDVGPVVSGGERRKLAGERIERVEAGRDTGEPLDEPVRGEARGRELVDHAPDEAPILVGRG